MNEKAETLSAPQIQRLRVRRSTGLDLNPRPPRSVRVSKRAAGTLMADRRYHPRTLRLRRLQTPATTGRDVGRGQHAAQRRARHGGRRRDRQGRTVRAISRTLRHSAVRRLIRALWCRQANCRQDRRATARRRSRRGRTGVRAASTNSRTAGCRPDASTSRTIARGAPSARRVRTRTTGDRRTDHAQGRIRICRLGDVASKRARRSQQWR